jgi:plasmid stabilization system protein ParE
MARQWVVRPLAEADIEAAAAWYEGQQSGLGLRFVDAVDHVLTRIRDAPLQFPVVSPDVRRALLHTFPYAVYFRPTEESVVILAVLHLRCDPCQTQTDAAITSVTVALGPGAVKARRVAPTARTARGSGLDGARAQRNACAYVMAAGE